MCPQFTIRARSGKRVPLRNDLQFRYISRSPLDITSYLTGNREIDHLLRVLLTTSSQKQAAKEFERAIDRMAGETSTLTIVGEKVNSLLTDNCIPSAVKIVLLQEAPTAIAQLVDDSHLILPASLLGDKDKFLRAEAAGFAAYFAERADKDKALTILSAAANDATFSSDSRQEMLIWTGDYLGEEGKDDFGMEAIDFAKGELEKALFDEDQEIRRCAALPFVSGKVEITPALVPTLLIIELENEELSHDDLFNETLILAKADREETTKYLVKYLQSTRDYSQFSKLRWLIAKLAGKEAIPHSVFVELSMFGNITPRLIPGRAITAPTELLTFMRLEIGRRTAGIDLADRAQLELAIAEFTAEHSAKLQCLTRRYGITPESAPALFQSIVTDSIMSQTFPLETAIYKQQYRAEVGLIPKIKERYFPGDEFIVFRQAFQPDFSSTYTLLEEDSSSQASGNEVFEIARRQAIYGVFQITRTFRKDDLAAHMPSAQQTKQFEKLLASSQPHHLAEFTFLQPNDDFIDRIDEDTRGPFNAFFRGRLAAGSRFFHTNNLELVLATGLVDKVAMLQRSGVFGIADLRFSNQPIYLALNDESFSLSHYAQHGTRPEEVYEVVIDARKLLHARRVFLDPDALSNAEIGRSYIIGSGIPLSAIVEIRLLKRINTIIAGIPRMI